MIKKLMYAAAIIAVTAFAACEKETREEPEPNDDVYTGTVDVTGAMPFAEEGIEWRLTKESDNTYTLYMDDTRFNQFMPPLYMEVRGMSNQGSDGKFKYETDEIIPYFAGEPMDTRTMTDFSCEADDETLSVAFVCMGLNVNYEGLKK